jgi:hypothetical protein
MRGKRLLVGSAVIGVLGTLAFASSVSSGKPHGESSRKTIDGSGRLEKREVPLADFSRIELEGAFDVFVGFGDEQKVEFTLDDNLFDNLIAESEGGALRLDWVASCSPSRKSRVDITMKGLTAIALDGAGDIHVSGIRGDRLAYDLKGAGDLSVDGEVRTFVVALSGAGNVDARGLSADAVDVRIPGVGNVTVTVRDRLECVISGVGNVTYYGDPEEAKTEVSGIGSIQQG